MPVNHAQVKTDVAAAQAAIATVATHFQANPYLLVSPSRFDLAGRRGHGERVGAFRGRVRFDPRSDEVADFAVSTAGSGR